MMITKTSSTLKVGPSVGNVPSEAGTTFFRAIDPAMAMSGVTNAKRPISMAKPPLQLYQLVLLVRPPNAEPLLALLEVYRYRISVSPWGPALRMEAVPQAPSTAVAENNRMFAGEISRAILAILISKASIFFPRYSGVRPTIRPAMNTARMAYISMPYSPAPTPPKITSPVAMLVRGTKPPIGVKLSCQALMAPHEASVVIVAKRAESTMPKRTSLPSILPPG